ncbi:MAG: SDR family NAD(P)-dependent oxidoreductase [Candidatus Kapabacteria bacterium]|jgi:enoyl-[acyl-carrier protein] reductase III|nr:SDR family NAD(P)-dependent oxidoreductase [Candidatus Kapabacteria bacterium]
MIKKNTYAIVLGASSGFGKATCLELARLGFNIYGVHMDMGSMKAKAEEFRQELEALGVRAVFFNTNAADDKNRMNVIEEIKKDKANIEDHRLRVLIHSLAFGALKKCVSKDPAEALTRKQIEMTIDVMANSLIYWTQDLFTNGLLANNSRIFAFTSIGSTMAMQSYGAVSAAKAALEAYIRQIAVELAPYGISANSIHAGLTDTPAASKIPGFGSMIKLAKIQNPYLELTTAEDIAKVVGKFVDEDFHWMNGTVIRLDGGEAIYKYFDMDF